MPNFAIEAVHKRLQNYGSSASFTVVGVLTMHGYFDAIPFPLRNFHTHRYYMADDTTMAGQ